MSKIEDMLRANYKLDFKL